MGRQIAVKLSREKEKEFSEFLKNKGALFVYRWSENRKIIKLNDIPHVGPYTWIIHIWNKKFPIISEFIEIKEEYRKNETKYGLSTIGKPLIEYCRGPVYRIYWDKDSGIRKGEYNVEEFEKWYNEVISWIKKNCKKREGVYVG